jgi:hypothetical protein
VRYKNRHVMKIPVYDGKIIRFEIDFGPKKMTGIFMRFLFLQNKKKSQNCLIETDSQLEK